MPLYEYVCLDCGHQFDAIRSIKDSDAPIQCDDCKGEHTSRKISLFSAHSAGQVIAGGGGGCASCGGGTCSTCSH